MYVGMYKQFNILKYRTVIRVIVNIMNTKEMRALTLTQKKTSYRAQSIRCTINGDTYVYGDKQGKIKIYEKIFFINSQP